MAEDLMTEINRERWSRTEHFDFFSTLADPHFSVTTLIDVTQLYSYGKAHQVSFYYALIYLSIQAMRTIENFRYRIRGNKVFMADDLVPSFTDLRAGTELFSIVNVPVKDSLRDFSDACKLKITTQTRYFPTVEEELNDECVYFSSLPWIHFTAITQETDHRADDSIPRITFGKYEYENDRLRMPICIRVNHRLMDGVHVSAFLERLEESINHLK